MIHCFALVFTILTQLFPSDIQDDVLQDKVSFTIRVNNEVNNYSVLGVFVMPGQALEIELIEKGTQLEIITEDAPVYSQSLGF